ncbi:unnamed protein product [Candida verbasci]|uniref:Uncharacterized protein n=1 Tax=Candida verbasci TaxID=1227364 RepID=A0A9W4U119_9ASCO|nr:unnamed protein product [Candida verbasci]
MNNSSTNIDNISLIEHLKYTLSKELEKICKESAHDVTYKSITISITMFRDEETNKFESDIKIDKQKTRTKRKTKSDSVVVTKEQPMALPSILNHYRDLLETYSPNQHQDQYQVADYSQGQNQHQVTNYVPYYNHYQYHPIPVNHVTNQYSYSAGNNQPTNLASSPFPDTNLPATSPAALPISIQQLQEINSSSNEDSTTFQNNSQPLTALTNEYSTVSVNTEPTVLPLYDSYSTIEPPKLSISPLNEVWNSSQELRPTSLPPFEALDTFELPEPIISPLAKSFRITHEGLTSNCTAEEKNEPKDDSEPKSRRRGRPPKVVKPSKKTVKKQVVKQVSVED